MCFRDMIVHCLKRKRSTTDSEMGESKRKEMGNEAKEFVNRTFTEQLQK